MPPVNKAGGNHFRKDVEFASTKDSDEYELVATGIVMVPDKADLQNDFAREDTIRGFADQFETFVEGDQAGGGIMHAVWPDGWMELERNGVLDESEDIGGQTVEEGSWVQEWGVTNADLADLIDDDILSGYSIGAIQVDWGGPWEQDDEEIDDVDTSEIPDDELVWELVEGIIREVSAVDIPAVPDAQILEAKALEKRLAEHIGNPDAFMEEMLDRGHTEADAQRVWDVLNEAMEADNAGDPGKQSVFAKAGKAFLSALSGTDDGDRSEDSGQTKAGQTLNAGNRNDLKAVMDATDSIFQDAGYSTEFTRFTDREDDSFDLSEHTAREFADPDEDEEEDDGLPFDVQDSNDDPEGDTSDTTDNMSDDNDTPDEELKDLVEQQQEQINELTETVGTIADAVEDGGEEKTVAIEVAGEVHEVTESEAKAWFDDESENDPMADAPGWAKVLKSDVDDQRERLDRINQQSGVGGSDQLNGHGDRSGENTKSGLDALGEALS